MITRKSVSIFMWPPVVLRKILPLGIFWNDILSAVYTLYTIILNINRIIITSDPVPSTILALLTRNMPFGIT